ncbi:hypothetical protein P9112_013549 [Eukaryota sp. TZLM1-RC]
MWFENGPYSLMKFYLLLSWSFIVIVFGCNHSIPSSDCSISGGTSPTCRRESFSLDGVTRYYAHCFANGARSCSQTYYSSSCDVEGHNNARCGIATPSIGAVTHIIASCESNGARRCSQQLRHNQCSIIGEDANCSTDFIRGRSNYLVATCEAHNAIQCSITCGAKSCEQLCPEPSFSAMCKCITDDQGGLSAKCGCGH